jgi:hypothetical protein
MEGLRQGKLPRRPGCGLWGRFVRPLGLWVVLLLQSEYYEK